MLNVKLIIVSTRPGRKGPYIGTWIYNQSKKNADMEVEVLDLAAIDLPFFNEANHPRMRQYEHAHTKKWSATIDSADAYIIVTPEYNYGYPATIKNALDYLYHEWTYKPVGFVSYGGQAAGTRAVQMLKQVVTTLKMVPLTESVHIPFFTNFIDDQDVFVPDSSLIRSADAMFEELVKWGNALRPMRIQ